MWKVMTDHETINSFVRCNFYKILVIWIRFIGAKTILLTQVYDAFDVGFFVCR